MGVLDFLLDLLRTPIKIKQISLPFNTLTLIIQFLLPFLLAFVIYKLLNRLLSKNRFIKKLESDILEKVTNRIKLVLRILLFIAASFLISNLFGAELINSFNILFQAINQPFFVAGQTQINLVTVFLIIPIVYIANWTAKKVWIFLSVKFFPILGMKEGQLSSISHFVRYLVMGVVILFGLSVIGLDLSSMAVIFGVLGIGVGFGLQSLVSNFFAGLTLIFARHVREGDRIHIGDYEGNVEHIKLLSTIMQTLTNETIIIPNSKLINEVVHNYSYNNRSVVIKICVQVAYGSPLEQVLQILKEVGNKCLYRLQRGICQAYITSTGDSGINLELWLPIDDIKNKYPATTWSILEIINRFKESNITIPFPQLDLFIKNNDSGNS